VLSEGVPFARRAAKIFGSFSLVPRHSISAEVKPTEAVFCPGQALPSCKPIKAGRYEGIGWGLDSKFVPAANFE
jgi:hypothetical protein